MSRHQFFQVTRHTSHVTTHKVVKELRVFNRSLLRIQPHNCAKESRVTSSVSQPVVALMSCEGTRYANKVGGGRSCSGVRSNMPAVDAARTLGDRDRKTAGEEGVGSGGGGGGGDVDGGDGIWLTSNGKLEEEVPSVLEVAATSVSKSASRDVS